jgi:hypothetical protein
LLLGRWRFAEVAEDQAYEPEDLVEEGRRCGRRDEEIAQLKDVAQALAVRIPFLVFIALRERFGFEQICFVMRRRGRLAMRARDSFRE